MVRTRQPARKMVFQEAAMNQSAKSSDGNRSKFDKPDD